MTEQVILNQEIQNSDPTNHTLNDFSLLSSCLEKAHNFQAHKQYSLAALALKKGLELDPFNAQLHNALGWLYLETKSYFFATAEFDEAVLHAKENHQFQVDRIVVRTHQGKHQEAIDLCEESLEIHKDSVLILIIKAECLRELDKIDQALKVYLKIFEIEPSASDVLLNLGNVYAEMGDFEKAIAHYLVAVKNDPDLFEAYYYLAVCYDRTEKIQEAIDYYQKAASFLDSSPFPYISQALMHMRLKNPEKAIELFENGLHHFPNSPFLNYNYGIFYLGEGNVRKCSEYLRSTIKYLEKEKVSKEKLLQQITELEKKILEGVEESSSDWCKERHLKLNFNNLVVDLAVLTESESEIKRNMTVLDKKINNFQKDLKLKEELSELVQAIFDSSKLLFEYFEFFMLLHQKFASLLNFKIPVKRKEFITFQVFKNEKLSALLGSLSSKHLCQMIDQISDASFGKVQVQRQMAKLICHQKRYFDPDRFFYAILYIVVQKLGDNDSKIWKIKEMSLNASKLSLTNRLFQLYPKMESVIQTPSQLLAVKEFMLVIIYMVQHSEFNLADTQSYEDIFQEVYTRDLFEKTEKWVTQKRNSSVFLSSISQFRKSFEFVLSIKNPDKAKSRKGLIFEFFLGIDNGQLNNKKTGIWRGVHRTPPLLLSTTNEYAFEINDSKTESTDPEKCLLQIICWKKKKEQTMEKKGEGIKKISELKDAPVFIFGFRQFSVFRSKYISVCLLAKPSAQ